LQAASKNLCLVPANLNALRSSNLRAGSRGMENKVTVVTHDNKQIVAPIVGVGPAKWTGNAIDLTFGATRELGLRDNSSVNLVV
jgi:hypothetical protein